MTSTQVSWPDSVEQVLDGDLAVVMATITPKLGVVLTPLTNFGLQDRDDGSVTVCSSLGAWRKLARIDRNPHVALAFHTRTHGFADGADYVLVQGRASYSRTPDRRWLDAIEPNWERFMGPRDRGLPWEWWMRVYQWERIGVRIDVTRVITWSNLDCEGAATVHGAAMPDEQPLPQKPPGQGTGARVDVVGVQRDIARLPDTLLSWVDGDGYPMVLPVHGATVTDDRLLLDVRYEELPEGGRRAGLISHWFTEGVLGQDQRTHTGWLDVEAGRAIYSPHTRSGYRLPPSKLLYRLAVGAMTRRGKRQAHRHGFLAK